MMRLLILFKILIFSVGCSTVSKKSNIEVSKSSQKHLTPKEVEELNKKTIEKVSKRLEQLSIAAKASGPDKVRFLASDMYLKASAALMEGDYQTANLVFSHLIKLVPDDDFIKKKYAVSLIRTGELEASKVHLVSLFEKSKKRDSKVGLVLAGVYTSIGEIKSARKIYSRLLKVNKKNEEACIFLAKSYAVEKKVRKATKLLARCEKANPGKGIYSHYIGKIYVDNKNLKKALKYFKRAHKIEKELSQSVMAMGLVYEELNKPKLAKKTYKKYLKKNPNDTLILGRLVHLLLASDQKQEVVKYAQRLLDFEPENLNLKVKLAIIYRDLKQFEKSAKTFKELLVVAPDNQDLIYYLASLYQEINEYEESIEYYTQITPESSLYQESSYQIAQMLSLMAKEEYAETKDEKLRRRFFEFISNKIEELPEFVVEFTILKATLQESIGEVADAIKTLNTIRDDKSFNDDYKFYLAALYEKEKKYSEAKELIDQIIEVDPSNAHAWNFLGYSLLEQNSDFELAKEYILKAIKLEPNDGYIRDSLGWYYYKIGELSKAIKELVRAHKLVPNDPSINKHVAIVYTAKKKFKLAKKYIKLAIKYSENQADRIKFEKALDELSRKRVPASFK